MKKLFSFVLVFCLIFCFAGCSGGKSEGPADETLILDAPLNVRVREGDDGNGIVTWTAVRNAQSYIVSVNGAESDPVTETEYTITDFDLENNDYYVYVVACAEGYDNSPNSEVYVLEKRVPKIGIEGDSFVRSGGTLTLKANVSSANKEVTWKVTEGGDYATIAADGKLTAKEVTGDKLVVVKAISKADTSVEATKVIVVTAKPTLTQDMLNVFNGYDKLSFDGYLNIDLYGMYDYEGIYDTFVYDIRTAMDGENWYAQYENGAGARVGLYYTDKAGVANQASVSFMNEEMYTPMLDEEGNPVSWTDSGMYNNFKGLSVNDFTFNEKTWRYEYTGSDDTFVKRVVSSANPYRFIPESLSLLIDSGDIVGIYSETGEDREAVQNGYTIQQLTVVINLGDIVDVPKVSSYADRAELAPLKTALDNMHALTSYTTEFLNVGTVMATSTYVFTGYVETVTDGVCHFRPYTFIPSGDVTLGAGDGYRQFTGTEYGFAMVRDGADPLYNEYVISKDENAAKKAYKADFAEAMPTLGFAAELFTEVEYDSVTDTYTYYVDDPMAPVACTFYRDADSQHQLYGLFATRDITSASSFMPYVKVRGGYIIASGFYYNLGYIYGEVSITYGDFDTAEISDSVIEILEGLEPRELPSSWDSISVYDAVDDDKDKLVNGLDELKTFYGKDNIADILPFFGEVTGDTFVKGNKTTMSVAGRRRSTIALLYDVPLDGDYTIGSYMRGIQQMLTDSGFTKKDNYYVKDGIAVWPTDTQLTLTVYLWKDVT